MRAAGSAVLMAMLLFGCGSSIRMVHQSNVYFERCHTADFDPSVSVDRKQQCWAQWLEHYTEGQSPDRIRYARQRLEALERGETIEPLPGLHAAGGTHRAAFLSTGRGAHASEQGASEVADGSADDPQDAAADPAATEDAPTVQEADPDADGSDAADADVTGEAAEDAAAADEASDDARADDGPPPLEHHYPSPPSNAETACTPVCNPRWDACVRACDRQPDGCEEACETEYRTCMRGCF